ncbi:sporulation integral membrane protein YtvI [Salimicrobium halophilum]|uniref:Sporulation integral membrane protein YtvI n=1 Tax=Salimicrobium halophilum TaxID=86666 RepID=A0A1G8QGU5_9BACI|nr:sporulation integral membrane protein YtvI [Salimicrobium halophilum]SDJ04014.1 sporulation integral membrane protein YtvI [Salimicrobium halophilum]
MFKYLTKRQWTLILLTIAGIIAAYFILPVSVPLIVAYVTALFLNPSIRWFQYRFHIGRQLAVSIVFLLFLMLLGLIGTFAVTRAVAQIIQLIDNAPYYISQLNQVLIDLQNNMNSFMEMLPKEFVDQTSSRIEESLQSSTDRLTETLNIENAAAFATKIPNLIVSLLVYLIALFLFMLELPRLRKKMHSYLTEETSEKVKFMNARLGYVVFGFLKAQFQVSIIIFIVTLLALLFIAPEVAVLMSLITWVVDFIPIIGSIAIIGPWSIYMFATGDIATGTQLAVLAIVLLAIRRTVEPKVMGTQIGLSPLATLIAMYIGLKLIGFLGFFIGPLVVIAFNSAKEAGLIKLNIKI